MSTIDILRSHMHYCQHGGHDQCIPDEILAAALTDAIAQLEALQAERKTLLGNWTAAERQVLALQADVAQLTESRDNWQRAASTGIDAVDALQAQCEAYRAALEYTQQGLRVIGAATIPDCLAAIDAAMAQPAPPACPPRFASREEADAHFARKAELAVSAGQPCAACGGSGTEFRSGGSGEGSWSTMGECTACHGTGKQPTEA